MEAAISKIFNIDISSISYLREHGQLSINSCKIDINKILNSVQNLGNYKTIVFENVIFEQFNLYKILKNFGKIDKNQLNISLNIIFSDCDILEWESFDNTIKFEKDINFNNIKKCSKLHFKNFNIDNIKVSFQDNEQEIDSIIFEKHTLDKFPMVDLKNRKLKSFIFQNITFKKELDFSKYELLKKEISFSFKECVFNDKINFQDIKNIKKDIDFSYSEFNLEANFSALQFDGDVDFSHCKFKEDVSFEEATFESFANFEECTFEKDTNFKNANFKSHTIDYKGVVNQTRFTNATFMGTTDFADVLFDTKPSFSKVKFIKYVVFNGIKPNHHIYFKESEFFENVDFKNIEKLNHSYFDRVIFHKNVDFANTKFENYISFTQANFKGATYFNNAIFKSFINMSNCTIDDVMSFYEAELYYTPYLAGVNVDKNAKFNLMYTKQNQNVDIKQAVDEYMENLKEDKEHIRKNKEYGKIKIAQGFRESFRILKSSLITNNNLLEASFYRVNELKAKELEMDLMKDDLSLSESLENLLFKIYKNTSNHHSDLLRILCFTLCMAGLYIVMSYFVTYIANIKISFMISGLLFSLLCFRYVCCKKDYLQLWFWGVLLYVVFWSIVFDVLTMFCFGMFVFMVYVLVFRFNHIAMWFIGALIGFMLVMHNPQTILPLGGIVSQDLKNYHLNQAILSLDEATSMKLAKTIDTTILTELKAKQTLLDNVKVLNDSVFDEYASLKNAKSKDSIMQKINFIYYLMMILCLFSLQKTARKNSIMPN